MRTFMILLFLISGLQSMGAGPWVRKPGSFFVQIGGSTIGYSKIYTDGSDKASIGAKVRDNVVQIFLDAGLLDRISISAMAPWKSISVSPEPVLHTSPLGQGIVPRSVSRSGVGDIDLTARYSLLAGGPTALSAQLSMGIPTGDSEDPEGILLGDGEFNVMPGISVGHSYHPLPLYVSASVGYNVRSRGFSHDIQYELEGGWRALGDELYLILHISGRESTNMKATVISQSSLYGLNTNNQEYLAITPKVFWKAGGGWAVTASWATAVHGRNIAGGFVFAGGLSYSY